MSTNSTAAAMSEAEERNQAKTMYIINGFFPLLGGLIFWLIGKDRSAFVDDQGKEAVNFGINIVIANVALYIVVTIIAIATLGIGGLLYLLSFALWIYSIIMGFQAGAQAEQGVKYRFPICPLRLIK